MTLNLRRLDLNLLLVFDALMQEQNLSRAATRLHMSQPAVSNALARLRSQLDAPLFKRTARGMAPTAHAQALYGPVRQALDLLRTGLGAEGEFDPGGAHRFRLAMSDYGMAMLLPVLLERLHERAPRTVLEVQDDEAQTLLARLVTGELDLAIDYLYLDSPDLCYQPFLEEDLVVIGRAGHPAFEGGMSRERYQQSRHVLILPRANRGSPLEIVLGSAKIQRKVGLQVPHFLSIPPIVACTELLGTVPQRLAEHFAGVYSLQLAPLPLAMPPVQVSLIWHRQQDRNPGLRWLREQIVQMVDERL
ncbi:LysR family transcriptional regulator BsrA [Stutzerimonas azotifigens]|uniref:LysR family transcriptional regulator BsrA n=1 Tax=Stutzerimonas azotifigens TaxID=291995 RepID=UPI0003FBBAE6|nr:LysR family transcriptional regulator [Stutzerimonas azotifigens]